MGKFTSKYRIGVESCQQSLFG